MTPSNYIPRTDAPPMWAHQHDIFLRSADMPAAAMAWEQRTGKSRGVVDTAAYRYEKGDIDGVLVIPWPNGLQRNWVVDEFPAYIPERIKYRCLMWESHRSRTKTFGREFDALLTFPGLAVFAVNAEAITHRHCKEFLWSFVRQRKTMLVADECDRFKTPSAQGTLVINNIAKITGPFFRGRPLLGGVKVKRILSGTIATENPFELWSQYRILGKHILGFENSVAFRAHFGVYEEEKGRAWSKTKKKSYEYPIPVLDEKGQPKYRNLGELQDKIAPYTFRVARRDVSDAPDQVYQKRYYEMSDEQRRVYTALRDEYRAELADETVVTASNVLTRYLRLQQVLGNRLPPREEARICGSCEGNGCDECDDLGVYLAQVPTAIIDRAEDPRLDALRLELEANPRVPTIVWARFQHEVTASVEMVSGMGLRPVRFDGAVLEEDRAENLRRFQAGEADVLVGNIAAGGRGKRMDRAGLMIFLSNYFSLRDRLQGKDRAEALGKRTATGVVDIICAGTIDEIIVATLRAKHKLTSLITGGNWREWL